MTLASLFWNGILGILVGGLLFILDDAFGASFYRWFYNWWHSRQLKATDNVGFIMGQKTQNRAYTAAGFYVAWLVLMAVTSDTGVTRVEIAWGLWMIPMFMVGFIAGPMFSRIVAWFPHLFGAVDNMEQDPAGAAKGMFASFMEAVRGKPVVDLPPAPAPAPAPAAAAGSEASLVTPAPSLNGSAAPAASSDTPPAPDDHKKDLEDFLKS